MPITDFPQGVRGSSLVLQTPIPVKILLPRYSGMLAHPSHSRLREILENLSPWGLGEAKEAKEGMRQIALRAPDAACGATLPTVEDSLWVMAKGSLALHRLAHPLPVG